MRSQHRRTKKEKREERTATNFTDQISQNITTNVSLEAPEINRARRGIDDRAKGLSLFNNLGG
jgi:hypothetical protein